MKTPPTVKLDDLSRTLAYRLLETSSVPIADGHVFVVSLWETARQGGRRIQVRTLDGAGLYDTNDCIGYGDAENRYYRWVESILPRGHLPEVERELVEALEGGK